MKWKLVDDKRVLILLALVKLHSIVHLCYILGVVEFNHFILQVAGTITEM